MKYLFELILHPNIRYRNAVENLSRCELYAMLRALDIPATEILPHHIGRSVFLGFESRPLTEEELRRLSLHSSVSLMAEEQSGLLNPLDVSPPYYLGEDLPEILKYKGKTSVPFTWFMINTALSLTPWSRDPAAVTLLDPLCGKGTSLFCALQFGMNAVGLDRDKRSLEEADTFFSRYLKTSRLKHTRSAVSETWKGSSIPSVNYLFADTKEHVKAGQTRTLRFACADTSAAPALTRRSPAHVLVADLPYGIQHAPIGGSSPESFQSLLHRALPQWRRALAPGGALAISFNEFTLPSRDVLSALRDAGFLPEEEPLFSGLRHEVEQAVSRNVIFAVKNKEDIAP